MGRKPFWYLRRRSVKADVDEELALHIEMRVDELMASGMTREDATRHALRQFGDLEATRRYCRQQDESREQTMQRGLMFEDFVQDVRISVRSLLRVPLLTITIVATVGIFLPAFVFVALSGPLVPKLRNSRAAGAVLDGVTVASLALMAVVTLQLARAALVDAASWVLAAGSFGLIELTP